ncbi:hypothetical protein ACS91J_10580 [Pectobacterium carotovorum]
MKKSPSNTLGLGTCHAHLMVCGAAKLKNNDVVLRATLSLYLRTVKFFTS